MKATDQYLKYVRWEADDAKYVGYCPDLFPWGGVCHGATEEETYRELCRLVAEEVNDLMKEGKDLPKAETRPMRDAVHC
jgi:predicted RNase H-like HicB family nuclease